jgi:tRNA A37 N6-isopentenylltransferase MiaA
MVSQLLQDIFHLAKRQDTWFRGMERRGMKTHPVLRGSLDEALSQDDIDLSKWFNVN